MRSTTRNVSAPAADLYDAWQEVFDNARPVEIEHHASLPDQPHERGDEPVGRIDRSATQQYDAPTILRGEGATTHGLAPLSQSAVQSPVTPSACTIAFSAPSLRHVVNASDGAAESPRTEVPSLPTLPTELPFETGRASSDAERTAPRRNDSPAEVPADFAPESVSVFLRGTGLTMVVRDSTLSASEAMRCAFEAARELTGKRASLEHLTVNGRVLYDQQPPSFEAVPATFIFAC